KGEALNAAFNWLRQGALGEHFDPDTAIVCVVDADGRLEADVLDIVLPRFNNPDIGGVQIGVRINNRRAKLLARLQDIEFVLYTELLQRGRRHLGAVGLGGSGQCVRYSALDRRGSKPGTIKMA